METKVGDAVWCFYEHRRDSKPVPHRIVGETKATWLVASVSAEGTVVGREHPINKRTMRTPARGGFSGSQYFTDESLAALRYKNTHAYAIAENIRRVDDVAILRAVAKLVGYDDAEKPNG